MAGNGRQQDDHGRGRNRVPVSDAGQARLRRGRALDAAQRRLPLARAHGPPGERQIDILYL